MKKTAFDPHFQESDLPAKIVAGLERVGQAYKVLLWDHAKKMGLSPIQIQLLIFIAYHPAALNKVRGLAREFNVTKPTISDAIKVLFKKGLIEKHATSEDSRSYVIGLSPKGAAIVSETEAFANPVYESIEGLSVEQQKQWYQMLSKLLFRLKSKNVLQLQRMCQTCRYFEKSADRAYCQLLERPLTIAEMRIDCLEHRPLGQ